jgi:putative transposase
MRHLLLLVFHLVRSLAILVKPGGVKALVAENLLLKHQLLILRRRCRRAPNLPGQDRLACGFLSLFLKPRRLLRTCTGEKLYRSQNREFDCSGSFHFNELL